VIKVLEPLTGPAGALCHPLHGKREVDPQSIKRSVTELGARCRLRYASRIVKIQDGQEKIYDLRYGVRLVDSRWWGATISYCTWW